MIISLLFAPINEFFERIPLGRIFNRLSKDLQVMELEVGESIRLSLLFIFLFLLDIVQCVYGSTPYVIIFIMAFIYFSVQIQQKYIKANREVVRLEAISKSPILSMFTEILNGLY
jgi:ATP-binding cassette subfamily C (CFTR/MRP) protein 2